MSKNNTFNDAAGYSAGSTELQDFYKENNRTLEELSELLKKRFKGNSKKQDDEYNKILDKMLKNVEASEKIKAAIEGKTQGQLAKEKLEVAKKEATIQLAAAENLGDKLKATSKFMGASLKEASVEAASKLANGALNLGKIFDNIITNYANTYSKYSASINARLQTFDNYGGQAFKDLNALVKKNLAASPYLKQEEMLTSLDTLVKQGISYNLEQRAFLYTMTDKIVTTFNALDETLLSMIRLQQQDTTQARMGMESYLTQYLNSTYQDTSYLNSLYDTVTGNLFEASSQLGRNASIELEYVVQKWLGSMYSVGVGSEFLSKISQGLGYLGSGNVNALQSDSALQNLLVMASNRSGVEYSQILAQGLNADTANKLLQGITSYVHEISTGNKNQVVRAQYADLFGLSLSDMTAMLNITTEEIGTIAENMLSYNDTIKELGDQLKVVGSRMHASELIGNVIENFKWGIAGNIASNTGAYVTYQIVDMVEQLTGGIAIPTISAFGNSVDLETTVTGLLKSGMVGASALGQIGAILGSLGNGGSLNLAAWAGKESTTRGTGFGGITSGYSKTTSTSTFIGSSSGSDIYNSSVTAAKDQAVEENKGQEDKEDILDLVNTVIQIMESWSDIGSNHIKVKVINTDSDPVKTDGGLRYSFN